MSAIIQVGEGTRDKLHFLARDGETYDEVLDRLIRCVEEMDIEEMIEARWEKLQREKGEYISLDS